MIDGNYLWDIKEESFVINGELKLHPVILKILSKRGIKTKEEIRKFLEPKFEDLYNPLLLLDMDKAIERINKAILEGENITIFGDYDVDGITGTAILYKGLKKKGAFVDYYIPARHDEGYGLNVIAIEKLAKKGTKLIITVDNGIACFDEVKMASDLGIDVIIFDHHETQGILPPAHAVVDPKRPDSNYPFKELSGAGVAFKFLQAFLNEEDLVKYLDIVAIGTIADLVPLQDENRIIVKLGLEVLKETENIGLKALLDIAGCTSEKIDVEKISYLIAPRLNAAGRMADAAIAVELLITEDKERAKLLAKELDNHNKARQAIESKIFKEVEDNITKEEIDKQNVIVVDGCNWHEGVIGIVASKITQNYCKPAVVISKEGEFSKGSCRSIPGFNIFQALSKISYLFEKYGGHEQAAGFTIKNDNVDLFKRKINEIAGEMKIKEHIPVLTIDLDLKGAEIDINLAKELSLLEPFGFGNPKPIFSCRNLSVKSIKTVGNGEKHLKIEFVKRGNRYTGIGYNYGSYKEKLIMAPFLDVAFYLEINVWGGREELQLKIKDLKIPYLKDSILKKIEAGYYREFFRLNFKNLLDEQKDSTLNINDNVNIVSTIKNKRKFVEEISGNGNVLVHFHTPYQAWRFINYFTKKEKNKGKLKILFNLNNGAQSLIFDDTNFIILYINPVFDNEIVRQYIKSNSIDYVVFYDPPFSISQYEKEVIIASDIPVFIIFNKEDLRYNYMVLENVLVNDKSIISAFLHYCRENFAKINSNCYEEPLKDFLINFNIRLKEKLEIPQMLYILNILKESQIIDFNIEENTIFLKNLGLQNKKCQVKGFSLLKEIFNLKKDLINFYNNFTIF
ncbi:single-stranded-DNA-specific exonuclease RecJ [Thermovenabulum sp.]|uniref:single-stranded-DNA-specific exonuclease RecJ n=1 Tax=Thermovenabulum sp. TaxID=3100335 RepID=UPI003C7AED11